MNNNISELFCDVDIVVPIDEYFSWPFFWSKKKETNKSQNNHSNNKRYDNIRGLFLEPFYMSVETYGERFVSIEIFLTRYTLRHRSPSYSIVVLDSTPVFFLYCNQAR